MTDDTYVGKHLGDYDPTYDVVTAPMQGLYGTARGKHAMGQGETEEGRDE